MKAGCFVFVAMLFALPQIGQAKELTMMCLDQEYRCMAGGGGQQRCMWMTGIGTPRKVELQKDPSYPNENFPQTIWNGHHSEKFGTATIEIAISVYEQNGTVQGYRNDIAVTQDGMTAESEGKSYLRAALRSKDKGIGWICTEMKVQ